MASSGENTCSDVLDGDNGVSGTPTDPIAAGSDANFKFAIGCDAKSGAPLHIDITIGSETSSIAGTPLRTDEIDQADRNTGATI